MKKLNIFWSNNKKLAIHAMLGFNVSMLILLCLLTTLTFTMVAQLKYGLATFIIGDLLLLTSIILIFLKKYTFAKYLIILVPPYTLLLASLIIKSHGYYLNIYTFLTPKFLCIIFLMTPIIFFGLLKIKHFIITFILLLPTVLLFDYLHEIVGVSIKNLSNSTLFYHLFIGSISVFYLYVLISLLLVQKSNLLFLKKINSQNAKIKKELTEIECLNSQLEFQSNLFKILEITSKNKPLIFILQGVLDEILELQSLKIKHKGLIFLKNNKDELNIAAHKNVDALLNICSAVKKGQCLCGKVLESKEKMFCNKVNHKHDITPENMKPHGHYVIPIKKEKEVLGVINIYINHGQKKDEGIINFLEVVAEILSRKIISEKIKEQLKKQQIEISEQSKKISTTLDELNQSISYAQFLQKSLIPNQETINNFFNESCVLFLPKDKVSGDFYFAHEIDNNLFFGVGDCTGHGIPGSMLASMSIEAIKYLVESKTFSYPNEILNELRKIAKQRFTTNFNDTRNDSMDAGMCMYDKKQDKLYFSGGFINLKIVRNNNEIIEFKGTKCPIGSYPVEYDFELHEIDLQKGDTLYLSSDGYVDQFGYAENKPKPTKFKNKRFRELLIKISSLPCNEQVEVLKETLNAWRKDVNQIDDITIFIAKH
jgi:serine phosphatase RsbU (regulator of sigma subunit)/cell division protein FtsL